MDELSARTRENPPPWANSCWLPWVLSPAAPPTRKLSVQRCSEYFLKAYVDSTVDAKPKTVLLGGQEIKTKLQTEIESSWYGQKSGNDALAAAAEEADRLLQENK